MGMISRLELVVFDFSRRNPSCDLQNEDKEVGFFLVQSLKPVFNMICPFLHTYIHTYIHVHTNAHTYMHVYIQTCIPTYMYFHTKIAQLLPNISIFCEQLTYPCFAW